MEKGINLDEMQKVYDKIPPNSTPQIKLEVKEVRSNMGKRRLSK